MPPAALASPERASRRPHRAVVAAFAGYLLLLLGWALGNPPFASPDESAHYVRALGLGGGEVVGERAKLPIPPGATREQLGVIRFGNRFARAVSVPAGLSPAGYECNWFDAGLSAACQDEIVPAPTEERIVTYVGGYPPLPYALPGAAARLGDDPGSANRLGRIAALLSAGALLATGMLLLASGAPPGPALLGPLVALTPLAVYLAAMLNPNGFETAAAFAFAAALLRLAREDEPPVWMWSAVAATGVLLGFSRTPGLAWILLLVGLFVLVRGPRASWRLLRRRPRAAGLTGALLLATLVAGRTWEEIHNDAVPAGTVPGGTVANLDFSETTRVLSQVIAYFAYGEFSLPLAATIAWWVLVGALLAGAFVVGTLHQRAVLGTTVVAALLLPAVISALLGGFTFFGRYLLPLMVAVPLLAADILVRRSARIPPRVLSAAVAAVAAVAAAVQLTGWYVNARRFAVGTDGPAWFLGTAEWSPPLGWWPWLIVTALGAGLLAASGALAARATAWRETTAAAPVARPGGAVAGTARR